MTMSDEMNENATQGPSRDKKMVLGGVGAAPLLGAIGFAVGTAAADTIGVSSMGPKARASRGPSVRSIWTGE